MIALSIAALGAAAWTCLVLGRGGFWSCRVDDAAMRTRATPERLATVVVIVPARNEAAVIGDTLASLLAQEEGAGLRVVVVDDHSDDGTAAVVRATAAAAGASGRVSLLQAPELPSDWTGKLWAMQHGVAFASMLEPPPGHLLLTDADIRYAPDTLSRVLAHAEAHGLVLTSLMARLRTRSLPERALVPAFIFFFQMLYPFAWVNRAARSTAAAAGGSMLVRRSALEAIGGLGAIRGELIDDCALARALKRVGPIWLGLSTRVSSERAYETWGELRAMITRCAFAQLRFSPLLLAGTVAGMLLTYVAPPVLAVCTRGGAQALGLAAWITMSLAFLPTLARYRVSPLWAPALPAIAAMYLVLTIDSALQYACGRGGMWKGRLQARAATSRRKFDAPSGSA